MRSWQKLLISVSAVVAAGGGAVIASASTKSAEGSQFSACLSSTGLLAKVSVNATPTCPTRSRLVTWNARGPQGSAGSSGAAGAAGSQWETGSGAPVFNSSQPAGELYLDTANGNVYQLVSGNWALQGNIEGPRGLLGPPGTTGVPGATGARGSLWSTGTGAPSLNSSQQAGDLYLDTASGNVYQLVSGSWTLEGNIEGPSGAGYNCSATAFPGVDYDGCSLGGSEYFAQNLVGAQFIGATLTDTFFNGSSNLDGANFSGANVSASHLYDSASFVNANFAGANLTGSFLYASGNFTNANFSGANLTDAFLYAGGNFTNANFTGANLTGAFLSETTLSTSVWNNTTCPGGTNSSAYAPQTCVGH
ncbi:MAG: hypothetical protein JWM55_1332 [Acidimicrobiaceae bacterium]|nr:hypothetical protein [Acidimicrobiaceae bacterium]